MGTYITIEWCCHKDYIPIKYKNLNIINEQITKTFLKINKLSQIFYPIKKITPLSPSQEKTYQEVLKQAIFFKSISKGAFEYKYGENIDLLGIAKGYIVDAGVSFFSKKIKFGTLFINAGGDLSFKDLSKKNPKKKKILIKEKEKTKRLHHKKILLRMGTLNQAIHREITLVLPALATSSFNQLARDQFSTTNYYHHKLRRGLDPLSTVVVQAPNLIIADALTKIALFAKSKIVQKTSVLFSALIWIFDSKGELHKCFGKL